MIEKCTKFALKSSMDRKDFIKKGLFGTGVFVSANALGNIIDNEIEELKPLEILGFNHIHNTNSKIMNHIVYHPANTRGLADHGWLKSFHTFSFANYYNPERMHFGALRVLNDDIVAEGMGFGTHPHDNMEIISIPLEGDLEHKDSMGNLAVIKHGEIQVMSAGSGITHSEYNRNHDKAAKFLQIWVFPNKKNVTPRYDQIKIDIEARKNNFDQILSPNANDAGVWIHQDAWFHLSNFEKGFKKTYNFKKEGNGLYVFLLNGQLNIANQMMNSRDGLGIWDTESIEIEASENAEFLLMEVPMQIA
jgi:hypothetical protein